MSSQPVPAGLTPGEVQRLRLAVGRLARRLRVATAGELTASQLSSLATVVHHGPLRIGELVVREAVNPTTLSRTVARLEEAGLVRRTADPADGRGAVLAATARGRRTLGQVEEERTVLLRAVVAGLPPERAAALAAALPALETLVDALPGVPREAGRR